MVTVGTRTSIKDMKRTKMCLYAGYYEMYITDRPLGKPYTLISWHYSAEAAEKRAQKEHPGDAYYFKTNLFPDDYQQPEGIPLEKLGQISYNSSGVYYATSGLSSSDANSFTLEQWAQMEAAGAVFLRNGVYKNDYDSYDDSFFTRDPIASRHYDIRYEPYYIFSDYSGPEWPDMIRLVKYVD